MSGLLDFDFAAVTPHPDAVRRIPKSLAFRHDVVSIATNENELIVAMEDPTDQETLDRIRLATGMHVRAVVASRWAIRKKLQSVYGDDVLSAQRLDDAPAVRAVDALHERALESAASDIHIEPFSGGGRARLRVDGLLHEVQHFPEELFGQVVSRLKLLGGLDIADRRTPQDGRYSIEQTTRSVDARVSSVPTIYGEKLVIRLLDGAMRVPRVDELGMPEAIFGRFMQAIESPHGFIVVTGPTGSGKTTTLYAALSHRNTEGQSICSVEDPVEIRLPGVAQVQINAKAGVTFAAALRSFLRQDPNLLMVGEMRDAETATAASAAALSGQLVLTTVHSNDAPSTIQRLLELGVARHTIASALTAIVAQRLVRRLCAACRVRSGGCLQCRGTGYDGRVAVFEAVFMTDELRDLIASGASTVRIAECASRSGYVPMYSHGVQRVEAGETSLSELRRVLNVESVA